MGIYLNSISSYSLYKSEYTRPYFVDKSNLLKELIPLAEQGNTHICITRPRQFGKTVMANMIGAFFSKGVESSDVFDRLQISADKDYRKHLNQHNVIYIDFSKMPGNCKSYIEYITRIEERLKRDLLKVYSEIEIYPEEFIFLIRNLWTNLMKCSRKKLLWDMCTDWQKNPNACLRQHLK